MTLSEVETLLRSMLERDEPDEREARLDALLPQLLPRTTDALLRMAADELAVGSHDLATLVADAITTHLHRLCPALPGCAADTQREETSMTLYELECDAIAELRAWHEDHPRDEPHDAIHEIADTSVPVYTGDLLRLAAENLALATDDPECGPAFDGSPTPVNIIAANVYEHLERKLWDAWQTLEEEADDDAA